MSLVKKLKEAFSLGQKHWDAELFIGGIAGESLYCIMSPARITRALKEMKNERPKRFYQRAAYLVGYKYREYKILGLSTNLL